MSVKTRLAIPGKKDLNYFPYKNSLASGFYNKNTIEMIFTYKGIRNIFTIKNIRNHFYSIMYLKWFLQ